MLVNKLGISNFRNITLASIDTGNTVNVFYGKNGSGKTSVLESLFYLSRAKSFRTNKKINLLKSETAQFAVSAELLQHDTPHRLGIGFDKNGESKLKLDGEAITRLSEASSLFPTQIITPESFDVFFSSPKARRSFLDFGLFHVEQDYQKHWSDYNKLLKQTNALLRRSTGADKRELLFWYKSLFESAQIIEGFRETFFEKHLSKAVNELAVELQHNERVHLIKDLVIRYRKKAFVDTNEPASEQQIFNQIEKDIRYKQVGFGPNRADISFYSNGEDIGNKLSRGQSKMFFYLLEIAMVKLIKAVTNKNILLLVDDLPSEVDEETRSTMLEMLIHSQAQIFVTGIEKKIAMEFRKYTDSVNVFHVEHGTVRPEIMEQLCP